MYYVCALIGKSYIPNSLQKYNRQEAFQLAEHLTYESTGVKYVAVPAHTQEKPQMVCPECNGEGLVEATFYASDSISPTSVMQCPECSGLGEVDQALRVPEENVLPPELLISSTELPF